MMSCGCSCSMKNDGDKLTIEINGKPEKLKKIEKFLNHLKAGFAECKDDGCDENSCK